MNLIFALVGFLTFIFGIVYLSDKFKPSSLSTAVINSPPPVLFLTGAFLTALCQSSSATGIIVLLLLDKRILSLKQTAMFLVGGNLGTTISGQIYSIPTGELVTPLILLTVLIGVLTKKVKKLTLTFNLLVSFSCIFFGLNMLKNTAEYYSDTLIDLFQLIDSGFGAFMFGCLTSAIFQSSSLIIGILVVLIEGSILTLRESLLAAFGVNVGTCSTLLLVSTGFGVDGKRGAVFHFIFNIMGVVIFVLVLPYFSAIVEITAITPGRVLANAHTLFNLITALVLLPLWNQMEKIVYLVYPK